MASTRGEILSLKLQGESLLWYFFVCIYTGGVQEKQGSKLAR